MTLFARLLAFGMSLVFSTGALVLGLLWVISVDELQFKSAESVTRQGGPVFNHIRHFSEGKNDIWMMNQSHHGPHTSSENWDRLAIVIDRDTKTAQFLQIEPGPLVWSENLSQKQVPFRAACYTCHSNGPRAIRPAAGSRGWREKATVVLWNFKIKSYGRVTSEPARAAAGNQEPPFRYQHRLDNDVLRTPKCVMCHRDAGAFARGALVRQNAVTIRFMIENGHMPPFGISLTEKEKNEILRFTNGI